MEAIGRLAGGIAHDFNTLLTAIVGYSALVSDDLPPDSPPREHVGEIQRAASIAGSLTRQLLIFSRKDVVGRARAFQSTSRAACRPRPSSHPPMSRRASPPQAR